MLQISHTIQARDPQSRVEQAAYVVDRIRSLGVQINPASRLIVMLRTLERGFIPYEDSRFLVALESIRDMYQLRLIVDQMEIHRSNAKFQASVQKMLEDAALPQDSSSNTLGRNTQFELYLAAICLRAGLIPVEYDEPDVTCVVEGTKFSIAAKRLKSLGTFKSRVKKAADQIRRSNRPGIVALDLSIARNPGNRPITSSLQSQLSVAIAQTRNWHFFDQHQEDIHRWVADSAIRALLAFEFTTRVAPDGGSWIHDGMMCWFPTTLNDAKAERELTSFQKGFLSGMPNLVDLAAE